MIRGGTFRYIKIDLIDEFHRLGWMIVSDMRHCHHGEYAVIMWRCDCEAP